MFWKLIVSFILNFNLNSMCRLSIYFDYISFDSGNADFFTKLIWVMETFEYIYTNDLIIVCFQGEGHWIGNTHCRSFDLLKWAWLVHLFVVYQMLSVETIIDMVRMNANQTSQFLWYSLHRHIRAFRCILNGLGYECFMRRCSISA